MKYLDKNVERQFKMLLGNLIRLASTKSDLNTMNEIMSDKDSSSSLKLSLIPQSLGAIHAIENTKESIEEMIDDTIGVINDGGFDNINVNQILADVQNDITKNMSVFFNKIRRAVEQRQKNS